MPKEIGGLKELRARLLRDSEVVQRAGFNDENRNQFDALMTRVEAIDAVQRGDATQEQRAAVMNGLADHDDHTQIDSHVGFGDNAGVRGGEIAMMAEALAARHGGPRASERAIEFTHLSTVDMARRCLERAGVSVRMLSANQVVTRALNTSSDFTNLLEGTGHRFLRAGYDSYQGGVLRIARASTAPDFRAKQKLLLGETPALVKVESGGEVTRGAMAESKESYSLETFARIFGITRQALVNDDLNAFGELTRKFGRTAAEFVAAQLASKLTSNPTLSDGVAVFHATHGNLGTAGVISITTLGEALKLMRLQKGLDGVTPIDVTPKYLVVPATQEVLARQHVALINATKASDVNPFTNDLEVVVDPRLDAVSTISWYMAADPAGFDTLEYSYLESEPGPQIETRAGFDVEGLEVKVRLDFGCGVIDHRGLLKNAGA